MTVTAGDRRRSFHSALWLRDNCPCPECRHESGQRLLDTRALPDDLVGRRRSTGTRSRSPTAISSVFDADWLRDHAGGARAAARAALGRRDPARAACRAATTRSPPEASRSATGSRGSTSSASRSSPAGRRTRDGDAHGRALRIRARDELRPAVRREDRRQPDEPRVHGPRPRRAHRQPVSRADADAAAAALSRVERGRAARTRSSTRSASRKTFRARISSCSPRTPIRFRYADADTELEAETPVISLDVRGDVSAVHYNTRSAQPFRLARRRRRPLLRGVPALRADARGAELPHPVQARRRATSSSSTTCASCTGAPAMRRAEASATCRAATPTATGCAARSRCCRDERPDRRDLRASFASTAREAYLGERVSMTEHMLQSAYAAEQDGAPPQSRRGRAAARLRPLHPRVRRGRRRARHRHAARGGRACVPVGALRARRSRSRSACTSPRSATSARPIRRTWTSSRRPRCTRWSCRAARTRRRRSRSSSCRRTREDAVRLRRYDDIGKVAGLETPDLEHYRPVLEAAMRN